MWKLISASSGTVTKEMTNVDYYFAKENTERCITIRDTSGRLLDRHSPSSIRGKSFHYFAHTDWLTHRSMNQWQVGSLLTTELCTMGYVSTNQRWASFETKQGNYLQSISEKLISASLMSPSLIHLILLRRRRLLINLGCDWRITQQQCLYRMTY